MGTQDVKQHQDSHVLRQFTRMIIQDVRAMERMLDEGMFETDVRRIGAEQELFLVDQRWQPSAAAMEVLALNEDPRVVTELTRFNLEFNLTPYVFEKDCLSQMERQITELLANTRTLAHKVDAEIALCGILPTIHLSDLKLDNMAPKPRYFALNDVIMRQKGGPAQYQIRGVDELFFKHDNILVEGCNTSFQLHLQVTPDEFAHYYNISQAVAAPCLAAAVNSPTLFGKRLWQETRIALFQQAVDTRSSNLYLREMSPRVHFGSAWIEESVTEIYKEDIARFRVLFTTDAEDPFAVLKHGGVPKLSALQLHNGTVYRWNRACYGISGDKPHLRIENRILPSGPTVTDEMANAAFWFGLVHGMAHRYDDIKGLMDFDHAKSNFVAAARLGLGAQFMWFDGRHVPAPELITETLLPIAREGLTTANINNDEMDRYLDIIADRVASQQTGAQWMLDSITQMKKQPSSRAERLDALVAGMVERQREGRPVHTWSLADLVDKKGSRQMLGSRVEHYMTTDLFTVHEDELVEFVACLMDWRRIRHVVVEDTQNRLVGLVTHRNLLRYLAQRSSMGQEHVDVPVKDIMVRNPHAVRPDMSAMESIKMMREHKVSALPVVQDDHLVGIITEQDFISLAGKLLDENLARQDAE